jgi:hypothetical protein
VKVTLTADAPVTFWEAVDRLGAAAGLKRRFPAGEAAFNPDETPFALALAPGRARPPVSGNGALRVEMLRVRFDRDRDYEAPAPSAAVPVFGPVLQARGETRDDPENGSVVSVNYRAELLVSAEPRLRVVNAGAPEKLVATDDRGRSLVRRPSDEEVERQEQMWRANPHVDPRLNPGMRYGQGMWHSQGGRVVVVPLTHPDPAPKRIARLSGVIPVAVVARKDDPVVAPLKGAAGKSFGSGSRKFTVHEVRARTPQNVEVELTLEGEPEPAAQGQTMPARAPDGSLIEVGRPTDLMELRLDAVDDQGGRVAWSFTRPPSQGTLGRMTLWLRRDDGQTVEPDQVSLRYWDLTAAATAVEFTFSDIPTP